MQLQKCQYLKTNILEIYAISRRSIQQQMTQSAIHVNHMFRFMIDYFNRHIVGRRFEEAPDQTR